MPGGHAGERLEVEIVGIADRREHAARVRPDRHQCAHENRAVLHLRHLEHGECERHECEQCDIVRDEHGREERERDEREHEPTRRAHMFEQLRADDAEHAHALQPAYDEHEADQLRDGAHMHVFAIVPVGGTMKQEINASNVATMRMVSPRRNAPTRCRIHSSTLCRKRYYPTRNTGARWDFVHGFPDQIRVDDAICTCKYCRSLPTVLPKKVFHRVKTVTAGGGSALRYRLSRPRIRRSATAGPCARARPR